MIHDRVYGKMFCGNAAKCFSYTLKCIFINNIDRYKGLVYNYSNYKEAFYEENS